MSKFIRAYLSEMIPQEMDSEKKPSLPKSLQWMPPGEHEISASKGGQPQKVKVTCGEQDAVLLDTQLQALLAEAAAGKCSRPFIDFDHEGKEAAAIPVRFFWQNGIRLDVEWTEEGADAISGRTYSYFSPEFMPGNDGHPLAIPAKGAIGALVNTPAFQDIERLSAALSGGIKETQTKGTHMTKLLEALAKAKLIPSAKLDETEATALFEAAWENHNQTIQAKDANIVSLETAVKAAAQADAENFVSGAVKAGQIKDDATVKAHWVSAYLKDGTAVKAMLAGIEVKAAAPGAKPAPPAPSDADAEKELATVRASLATETDPVKAAQLAHKARELRGHKGMFEIN